MVKRYEVNWHDGECLPYELDDGRFTLHTDYAKLEAERDALREMVDDIVNASDSSSEKLAIQLARTALKDTTK